MQTVESENVTGMPAKKFLGKPVSQSGKTAAWLLLLFFIMFLFNGVMFMPVLSGIPYQEMILPYYGIAMLLVGITSSVFGLIALIKKGDRSWLVWVSILPCIFVIFLLLGEFLIPH